MLASVCLNPSIFEAMQSLNESGIQVENLVIESKWLEREVKIDCYLPSPSTNLSELEVLLINDGQNLEEMAFASISEEMMAKGEIVPIFSVGIHAGPERKMEYGVAGHPDYLGRGAKAAAYTNFILQELLPHLHQKFPFIQGKKFSFAGFSLGGLMALDIVWTYPQYFQTAGVFSGSLWWRNKDQNDPGYKDETDRIMHQKIRNGSYHQGLRFFFQCGNKDETMDRNNNGIIDSIDDTIDMIKELELKGYNKTNDIFYLEMPDGSHDIPTWALAMPVFLRWAFGR